MDRLDVDFAFIGRTRVYQSFLNGLVGVLQLHIFAHQADRDFVFRIFQALQELLPFAQFRLGKVLDLELANGQFVEMLLVHIERHLVDAPRVDALDHVAGPYVAEQRDLAPQLGRERLLRAAHDHVGLDAALLQHLDGVLCGLGFQLLGGFEIGDKGQMNAHTVFFGQLPLQLAHRLDEGLRFHIADRAADLREDDVVLARAAQQQHPALDFVGDVGHDLDGLAQVGAFALLGDHGVVDLAGGHIVGLGSVHTQEALVVPEIQVGLRAVFRDVAFSVLIGVERAGIDVDVGVEFLDRDAQSSRFQEFG